MPQLITDGELVKKTLRTTLVMLGSTAVWLAALTGAVVVTTGPSSGADAKAEKAEKASAGMPTAPMAPMQGALKNGAAMPGPRTMHRAGSPAKAEPSHTGDPI
jgi:hypothetical protein